MNGAEVRELARRFVPGHGEPQIEVLRAGLVNRSFEVLRDGLRCVLRVDGGAAAPGVERHWECRVLRVAAAAGLAPPLLVCDPDAGVLITEWVEGEKWTAAQAMEREAQRQVATLVRRIHSLPLPQPVRRMDVSGWCELYASLVQCRELDPARRAAVDAAQADASRLLMRYAHLPPAPVRLCHSDLHRHNLLLGERHCWLLDWEYAHAGDPFWDLAGWAGSNGLAEQDARFLLDCYLQREPLAEEAERLMLLIGLYKFVCLLWSESAQAPGTSLP